MTRHGFTLIELLLALTLLGVISLGVAGMFPTLVKVNRDASNDQTTTFAAKRFMEDVRGAWADRGRFDGATLADGSAVEGHVLADGGCTARVEDPDAGAFAAPIRKRIVVACTGARPTEFVLELGRP